MQHERAVAASGASGPSRAQGRYRVPLAQVAAVAVIVAYAAALAFVGPRHEPWFDEAQSWLIARDADAWTLTFHLARYEGAPALWPLILFGLQKLGLGYSSLWLVSSGLGLVGAVAVMSRAPFPIAAKAGIVFSYVSLYQFAIVARSYALDLALTPIAASLFAARVRRPLVYLGVLGILANTNAFGFVIAGCLAVEFAWSAIRKSQEDRRRRAVALALYCFAAGVAVLQAWPVLDADTDVGCCMWADPWRPIVLFTEAMMDPGLFGAVGAANAGRLAVVLAAAVFAPMALLWRAAGRGWLALSLFGSLAVMTAVLVGQSFHSGLIWLTALFLLWICWRAREQLGRGERIALDIALTATLVVQDVDGLAAARLDISRPYAAGPAAAALLDAVRRDYPTRTIAAIGFKVFMLQPYLPRNPFANATGDRAWFVWRKGFGVPLAADATGRATIAASRRYDLLVISDDPQDDPTPETLDAYREEAAGRGYCLIRTFAGRVIWKSREVQPDGVMVFGRCDESWSALTAGSQGSPNR